MKEYEELSSLSLKAEWEDGMNPKEEHSKKKQKWDQGKDEFKKELLCRSCQEEMFEPDQMIKNRLKPFEFVIVVKQYDFKREQLVFVS